MLKPLGLWQQICTSNSVLLANGSADFLQKPVFCKLCTNLQYQKYESIVY